MSDLFHSRKPGNKAIPMKNFFLKFVALLCFTPAGLAIGLYPGGEGMKVKAFFIMIYWLVFRSNRHKVTTFFIFRLFFIIVICLNGGN